MVATNAVKQRTGNVSAGTSSFSMIVLEKELSKPYEMIDMVTTPDGSLVAMVHCNNCTSDLNAWVNLFKEYQELLGIPVDMDEIYSKLYNIALTGDTDCGGLLSYNYISGEPVTGLADGRPLFVRSANDKFNLANFMRTHLYASVGRHPVQRRKNQSGQNYWSRRIIQNKGSRPKNTCCSHQLAYFRDGNSR